MPGSGTISAGCRSFGLSLCAFGSVCGKGGESGHRPFWSEGRSVFDAHFGRFEALGQAYGPCQMCRRIFVVNNTQGPSTALLIPKCIRS